MPQTSIRVISKDVGGSFGLRRPALARGSRDGARHDTARAPGWKWIEDRLENIACQPRRANRIKLRAAFDSEGKLLASHAEYGTQQRRLSAGCGQQHRGDDVLWGAHKMPKFDFYSRGWFTNTVGPRRLPRPWAIESLVREVLLDRAARKLGIDADRVCAAATLIRRTGSALHHADGSGARRHQPGRMPRRAADRRSMSPPSASSRPKRASRAAIWAWASRPTSNRPRAAPASPVLISGVGAHPHIEPTGQRQRGGVHALAGPRHADHDGAGHRRAPRRALRRRQRLRGRQLPRRLRLRRLRQPPGRGRRRRLHPRGRSAGRQDQADRRRTCSTPSRKTSCCAKASSTCRRRAARPSACAISPISPTAIRTALPEGMDAGLEVQYRYSPAADHR